MKKFSLVFIFFILAVGAVFSQEKAANARNNWISASFNFFYDVTFNDPEFGGSIKYERMLNPYISLGANAYIRVMSTEDVILPGGIGIDAVFHYYPWGKTFFVGIALGYGGAYIPRDYIERYYIEETEYFSGGGSGVFRTGIVVTPEIGWKIDVGNVGGFYLQTGVSCGFLFFAGVEGLLTYFPQAYLGMGFAF
jgi:hypothetical protein